MKIAGLKVVDAKRPLTVKVTARDCANGNTKDPSSCAAARALLREADHCTEARVHLGRTYIKVEPETGPAHWLRYQTPESMRGEIISFDRGASFEPGEYTLRPMSPTNRLGAARGSDTNKTTPRSLRSKNKKRKPYHTVSGVRSHGANR